jgi:pimeloyl-ACP methyl ester carboxylesterase
LFLVLMLALTSSVFAKSWTPTELSFERFKILSRQYIPHDEVNYSDEWEKAFEGEKVKPPSPRINFFNSDPDGTTGSYLYPDCTPYYIEKGLFQRGHNLNDQYEFLLDRKQRCEENWNSGESEGLFALLNLGRLNYDLRMNPLVHPVAIQLEDGYKLRGLLALKPDGKKRPLIIAKCGLFCAAANGPVNKVIMMHMFDESPFHVLILGNMTGPDYQKDNGIIALGGFEEGRQILDVASLVSSNESTLKDMISSIHVLGLSLGGHAAFYSGLYSALNDYGPQINSILTMCPVVDLEPTFESIFEEYTFRGIFYRFLTLEHLRRIFYDVPVLGRLLNLDGSPENYEIKEALAKAALEHYIDRTRDIPWNMEPFYGEQIDNEEEFWQFNNFLFYPHHVKVPTLVLAAENDALVLSRLNGIRLGRLVNPQPGVNVKVVNLKEGNHCAFSQSYGWNVFGSLVRSYFLSHSPEFVLNQTTIRTRIDDILETAPWWNQYQLYHNEIQAKQIFEFEKGKDWGRMRFEIFKSNSVDCRHEDFGEMEFQPNCFRSYTFRVPLSRFPTNFKTPKTHFEAKTMTRLANSRFHVLAHDKLPIQGRSVDPFYIEFKDLGTIKF